MCYLNRHIVDNRDFSDDLLLQKTFIVRFGALFEDKCTRNFRNMPCNSKVFVRDKCLIHSFFSLFYRMYNVLLSLPFPCFPAAGSTVANCGPDSPRLATVEPATAKRKKRPAVSGKMQ